MNLLKPFFVSLVFSIALQPGAFADQCVREKIHGVFQGMTQEKFFRIYPKKMARTYREDGNGQWITFNEPFKGPAIDMVTFHIEQGKVMEWKIDDRDEVVDEYLGEFCSQGIIRGMPKIYSALKEVLRRIPLADFLNVTDRHRPVLVTEYYDSGTARFANTSEIISSEDDAPAGEKGLTIIKLSSALNDADSSLPIEGVLAHELAHRVLDHARKGRVTCNAEREANQRVRQWGFSDQFKEASRLFGRKEGESVSCQEE